MKVSHSPHRLVEQLSRTATTSECQRTRSYANETSVLRDSNLGFGLESSVIDWNGFNYSFRYSATSRPFVLSPGTVPRDAFRANGQPPDEQCDSANRKLSQNSNSYAVQRCGGRRSRADDSFEGRLLVVGVEHGSIRF